MSDIVDRLCTEIADGSEWMLGDDHLLTDAKTEVEALRAENARLHRIIDQLEAGVDPDDLMERGVE